MLKYLQLNVYQNIFYLLSITLKINTNSGEINPETSEISAAERKPLVNTLYQ